MARVKKVRKRESSRVEKGGRRNGGGDDWCSWKGKKNGGGGE
jgi:hypothetical protein